MRQQPKYRPTIHYTPEKGWINDPNGLVYIDGTYHLFCQHYPDAEHWDPMHWGHAVSKDLLHWTHLPTADIDPDGAVDLAAVPQAGARIVLGNGIGEKLIFSCSDTEWTIDRSHAGRSDFSEEFCSDRTGVIRFPKKLADGRLRMIFDRSILEMEGDDGLTFASVGVYPNEPYTKIWMSGLKDCRMGSVR